MEFGVFDHLDASGADLVRFYEDRLAYVEAYDRGDFHAYFVAEHHATPLGMAPSPAVFLSSVAQRSRRLRFGPLVYCLSLHNPLRVLEEICMLDNLSGGRLELGLGRGISPIEMRYFGVEAGKAQAMFEESRDIIMRGLAGGPLDHAGAFFTFKDVPVVLRPAQHPHPPLWYGVSKPESVDWCAREGVNIGSNQPLAKTRAIVDRFRKLWAENGRDPSALPRIGATRHVVVAETDAEALSLARRGYALWFASFMNLFRKFDIHPPGLSYPPDFDDLLASGDAIAGSPSTVRDQLRRQIGAMDVTYLFCRFAFGDLAREEVLRSIDLFNREAIPAFR